MTGTLINAGAVLAGSAAGLLLHARLPRKITTIAFQGIGLFTLFLGFTMASKTSNFLILIFSIIIGSIFGELMQLEKRLESFGDFLKRKLKSKNHKFSEGFITAFLLFCMGSMTILGAFEEGLGGKPTLLSAKSVLDGFASVALSAAMGIGVMFSIIPLIIYQGGLTLFAGLLENVLTEHIINEMTAAGGLILLGLGINILEIKKLKVLNMLPALMIAVILAFFIT